jgi:alcohol dehydrogenase
VTPAPDPRGSADAGSPVQTETIGWGAIRQVGDIIAGHAPSGVFLVASDGSFRTSGAEAALEPVLARYRVVRFSGFATNPRLEDVLRALELFRESGAGLILAVGGGTPIDIGKAVRTFSAHQANPRDLLAGRVPLEHRGPPLIAVPTTAGSGSEATRFAVVYVDGVKHSLDHSTILPDHSVVDASLTTTLPPRMTAATGMDALAQGIESIWSVRASDASIIEAAEAVRLSLLHLPTAVNAPTRVAREGMALAAHLAGRAIDQTRTTGCHAISYPITSHFGVPHGHAVALTLPAMLEFNSGIRDDDSQDPRGAAVVRERIARILALLGVASPSDGRRRLVELLREIGLEASLSELGIEDHDLIVREGFNPARMGNNPRALSRTDLEMILAGEQPA